MILLLKLVFEFLAHALGDLDAEIELGAYSQKCVDLGTPTTVVCGWVDTMSDMNTIQSGIISGTAFASSLHSGCHGLIRGKKSRLAPNP